MKSILPNITLSVLLDNIGTKNVSKELKKITQGRVRDRGKTWFPELTDKRKTRIIVNDNVHVIYSV